MTDRAEMLEMLQGGPIRPREIAKSDDANALEQLLLIRKNEEFLARLRAEKRG